jgi:tetratricopeptide (TPR) repeat protein
MATAQVAGERTNLAFAHALLGMIRISQGDAQAARPLLEEGRAEFHAVGDRSNDEAYTLYFLARAGLLGSDLDDAQRVAEESLALFTQSGHEMGRALALSALGAAALAQGDTATAGARFAEAMPSMRATGGLYFLADFLFEAGIAWMEQGDLEQAQQLLAESLGLWRDIGRPKGISLALAGLSEVAAARGQPRRAARLLGAAAMQPAGGPRRPAFVTALVDRAVAAARDALGPAEFEAAQAEGAALSHEQAIAEALEDAPRSGKGTGGLPRTRVSD